MENQTFNEWAIVELFGHTKIAGKVSSQIIGACSFVRIDVPALDNQVAYTRLFGEKAIYSITPTDEKTVLVFLRNCRTEPIERYYLQERVETPRLPDHDTDSVHGFDLEPEDPDQPDHDPRCIM